jgi:hypothetical protein
LDDFRYARSKIKMSFGSLFHLSMPSYGHNLMLNK